MPHPERDPDTGRFVRTGDLDRYPQWMNLPSLVETTGGTFRQDAGTNTPVVRQSSKVMEILGVQWEIDFSGLQGIAADLQGQVIGEISTRVQTGIVGIENRDTIDGQKIEFSFAFPEATESGCAAIGLNQSFWHGFSQGGHGFLTAAPTFFLGVLGFTGASQSRVRTRILYRLVQVSAAELIGLLTELTS